MTNVSTDRPPPPIKPLPASRGRSSATEGAGAPRTAPTLGKPNIVCPPLKLILNAVEGWGKTSCGAYMRNPTILMAKGETGYATLLGFGRVPQVETLTDADGDPRCVETWLELLDTLDMLAAQPGGEPRSLVLDALSGFERLCHQHELETRYKGDDEKFMAYHKGYDTSVGTWLQLLYRLDTLTGLGWTVMLLSHSKIGAFRNPLADDFDRYIADMHPKLWSVTVKWADAVLFGTFLTITEKNKETKRIKGVGGDDRVIYTQRRDAWDAKNRFGMAERIDVPNDPTEIWTTIRSAIVGGQAVGATTGKDKA